jgi:hypothetical protein
MRHGLSLIHFSRLWEITQETPLLLDHEQAKNRFCQQPHAKNKLWCVCLLIGFFACLTFKGQMIPFGKEIYV